MGFFLKLGKVVLRQMTEQLENKFIKHVEYFRHLKFINGTLQSYC